MRSTTNESVTAPRLNSGRASGLTPPAKVTRAELSGICATRLGTGGELCPHVRPAPKKHTKTSAHPKGSFLGRVFMYGYPNVLSAKRSDHETLRNAVHGFGQA